MLIDKINMFLKTQPINIKLIPALIVQNVPAISTQKPVNVVLKELKQDINIYKFYMEKKKTIIHHSYTYGGFSRQQDNNISSTQK